MYIYTENTNTLHAYPNDRYTYKAFVIFRMLKFNNENKNDDISELQLYTLSKNNPVNNMYKQDGCAHVFDINGQFTK